ncbi:TPM domain-containing protein [Nostoc linckia FACHB-104]|nr:TPM domain-containing protein [Nostoc linckia FACHB-104]
MKWNLGKLKPIFWVSLFSSVILLCPLSSLALNVQEVPNPRKQSGGWVTDMAGILSDKTETQINQIISQLESKNGTEMAVVTVPKTAPAASPKQFATQLFNHWKIGKQGKDNGVLFLISVSDRRVEIETGYGVEAILPDAKVGNIIDSEIIPQFKKGNFEGGTLAGTKALVVVLQSPQQSLVSEVTTPNPQNSLDNSTDNSALLGLLAGSGILALGVGSVFYFKRTRTTSIKPEGRTRLKYGRYIFSCADCQQPMEKVDETIVKSYLTKPEQTAHKLGSVKFEGWKCPNCSSKLTDKGFNLVALESYFDRFKKCPHCQELTVTSTKKTIKSPTQFSSGKRLITDNCQSCDYQHQTEQIIPPLPPPPPPPPPSSGGSSSSWGGYGGGGFSDGGGGGFGGGSSGGGGAGGSW